MTKKKVLKWFLKALTFVITFGIAMYAGNVNGELQEVINEEFED